MENFSDALPRISTAYHQGLLVPFIGSGMSLGACVDWRTMLRQLASEVGYEPNDEIASAESEDLYRLADRLTALIEARTVADRERIYRSAISARERIEPPQTNALASVLWPLVISTNYDDVYWSAIEARIPQPTVLGRSVADCHRVLVSLDTCVDPILWSIQGYVGGPTEDPSRSVPKAHQREQLVEQVVVGHRQYQRATSDAAHFRRAFAEVYRRRSLWFLGSGITESYLVNLFSEIRDYYGIGRHPHFACIKEGAMAQGTQEFLQSRLGILPILYPSHDCLPKLLKDFVKIVRAPEARLTATTYSLPGRNKPVLVQIVDSPLPKRSDDAVIVSVGRCSTGTPIEGSMAQGARLRVQRRNSVQRLKWRAIDRRDSPAVYRYGDSLLFAVAARTRDGDESDVRDLGVIPEVVEDVLKRAAEHAEVIHVGAVASGPERPWHPVHPFVQTLLAVRSFVASDQPCKASRIVLHVVDWRLQMPLRAGLIPIPDILFSKSIRYRVEVCSDRGTYEAFTMVSLDIATVQCILTGCGLELGDWDVELIPMPSRAMIVDRSTLVPPSAVVRVAHRTEETTKE